MVETSENSNDPRPDQGGQSPPPGPGLLSASFLGLLATQFLGATNDNILRWLVIGIGKQYVAPDQIRTILSVGSACFVLPYILLAAPAGFLADRFSKRTVIVSCKVAEIAIAVLAVAAILIGSKVLLFAVVATMGAQSALFGPSKLGSIPEILPAKKISSANGVIGLTTVIATVLGAVIGNWLATPSVTGALGQAQWWKSALVLVGVAVAGTATSLAIRPLAAANPLRRFPWDFVSQSIRDLRILSRDLALLRVALGIMFFWSLGMLANLNIDQFAFEGGADQQTQVSPLLAALVVGVGLGSVLAGVWSGGKVELGILPLGAGGLALFAFLLYTVEGTLVEPGPDYTWSYLAACFFLLMLGVSSGLFDVPLAAFMQHRSPPEHRGAILAASNFLTFSGLLVVSLGYYVLRVPDQSGEPLFSARQIFLLCGILTIPVFIYIVFLIPQATIKFLAWLAAHTVYRIYFINRERLPERGGALLASNHVTWVDAVLLLSASSRPIRFLIDTSLLTNRWLRGLARIMGVIPIRPTPKAARKAIAKARRALRRGELVCIFPEGEITRSGHLQSFKPGILQILKGTSAPVIPVYLDELWGSIFSFHRGRFLWKWPQGWPRRVSIWFGKPMTAPHAVHEIRQAVQELGADAVTHRRHRTMVMPRAMIRACRKSMRRIKVADSSGMELSGGQLLTRSIILRRLLAREVLSPDEKYVGLLLPPSVGGVVANAAVSLLGSVAANLNYAASSSINNKCIERAGIRTVLTSRKVVQKLSLDDLDTRLVVLEDLRDKVTRSDKLAGVLGAYATPAWLLDRLLGLHKLRSDDELTVIFTSGSTGIPKGVSLSHHNIATNVQAIDQVVHPEPTDVILGILPFFHSFGYMVTLWAPLTLDVKAAYHFSPLDAREIGRLARERGATIMVATPTFLRSYMKRCQKEEFATLDVVVAGAEKLPSSLCDAFEEKFGVRPVEGYGATELSPLVSVNIPPSRSKGQSVDRKEGTVGRPIPGVSAKIVNPESFDELPLDTPGMLLVKGPNVMLGYLGQPDKTEEVIRDGWYVTGDIAAIDADGFITITGRLTRFSKIGGEMVPHVGVEEAIGDILSDGETDEGLAAVTSVPDERKGERLIVLHKKIGITPEEIRRQLSARGFDNLWIPSADSFLEVEEIPLLGSGKFDLRRMAEVAREHFCSAGAGRN